MAKITYIASALNYKELSEWKNGNEDFIRNLSADSIEEAIEKRKRLPNILGAPIRVYLYVDDKLMWELPQ